MLLVAEFRQGDANGGQRLAAEIGRVDSHSYALVNAILIYTRMEQTGDDAQLVRAACVQYLARAQAALQQQLKEKKRKLGAADRRTREAARQQTLDRFRKKQ